MKEGIKMDLAKLDEYRKAAIAGVVALFALLAFFITFDPGTQVAAVAVVVAVFNVITVAIRKNHTLDDLNKAAGALTAAVIGLVAFFITVDPNTVESIGAVVLSFINVYGVYRAINAPRST